MKLVGRKVPIQLQRRPARTGDATPDVYPGMTARRIAKILLHPVGAQFIQETFGNQTSVTSAHRLYVDWHPDFPEINPIRLGDSISIDGFPLMAVVGATAYPQYYVEVVVDINAKRTPSPPA
jgi:hypothetical protein